MPLQKTTKDVVLGGVGLNVKTDPQLQPDGMLVQARDIYYTLDGSLMSGYADTVSTLGTTGLPWATLASVTKENTALVAARFGLTRNYDGALADAASATNPFLSATTLRTTQVQSAQLPLIQLAVSGSVQYANARNVHSCALSLNSNFGASKILVAWDVINPGSGPANQGVITYGIWDTAQGVWFLPPTTLAIGAPLTFKNGYGSQGQVGGIQPMCLPSGHIVYSTNITGTGGFKILQGVCVTLNANGLAGTYTTLDPNYTGTSTLQLTTGALQDMEQQPLNSTLAVFALGYSFAGPNVWLYTVVAGGTPTTLRGSALTTANTSTVVNLAITVDTPVTAPSTSRVLYIDTNTLQEVSQAGAVTRSGTGNSSAILVLSSDGVSNYYLGIRTVILSENAVRPATCPLITGTLAFTVFGATPIAENFVSNIFAYQLYDPATKAARTVPAIWVVKKNVFVCYDLTTGKIMGRWAYLAADSAQTSLPQCVQAFTTAASGVANTPDSPGFVFLTDGATLNSTQATTGPVPTVLQQQLQFVSMTYGATYSAEVPSGSLTNGLSPLLVGPQTATEDGFSWAPTFTLAQTTGTLTGSYVYAACWQWVDDYGNVMWGRPTFSTPIILASQGVTVSFSTRTGPSKGQLYLFRSTAGGTSYYGIGPVGGTVTDTISDANLINGNILLYTSATGELPNDPMPPCNIVAATSQCAVAASAELAYRLYVSKPFVAGRSTEWNFGLYVDVSPATGPITGLAVMDDKIVVFKQNTIFVMAGSSFDATGANASQSFTQPQQLATYYGCVNAKSVQVTNQGTFFQSPRGIELLGRDLAQNFIGQVLDGINMNIVDSALVQTVGHVRFLDSVQQTIWVWDAVAQKWSSRSLATAAWAPRTQVITALATQNQRVFAGTSSYVESTTTALTSATTTGWVKMSGLQGFSRLYRFGVLGTAPSGTVLTIQAFYNYNPTAVDTFTYTVGATTSFQFRARVSLQKIESVQFAIAAAGVTSALAPTLSGISLEYGVNPGVFRMGPAQTVG